MNNNIRGLIERIEGATGPDREIDALIAPLKGLRVVDEGHPFGRVCYDDIGSAEVLPRYTSSIDAAMTLAKPNWWFSASAPLSEAAYGYSREDQRMPRAGFEMIGEPYSVGARAATIPLAICAAALRARITQEQSNGRA